MKIKVHLSISDGDSHSLTPEWHEVTELPKRGSHILVQGTGLLTVFESILVINPVDPSRDYYIVLVTDRNYSAVRGVNTDV